MSARRRYATFTFAGTLFGLVLGLLIGWSLPSQAATMSVTGNDINSYLSCLGSAKDPTKCVNPNPTPSATPSPSPSASATPSPSSTPTPTPPPVSPSPSPSPTPSPAGNAFPDASTTGVPAGTTLTAYTGPTTIKSCGVTIDHAVVNGDLTIAAGNGTHSASTPCVTITNSIVRGQVDDSFSDRGFGPTVLRHVEIAVPVPNSGDFAGLTQSNWYAWNVNIHGARTAADCDGNCELHDSWLHDEYFVSPNHLGGFLANSGSTMLLDHNTLSCNLAPGSAAGGGDGGCSGDVNLFGDFGQIANVRVTNNLLVGSQDASYCMYAGSVPGKKFPVATGMTVTGNVWQRGSNGKGCSFGPLDGWDPSSGTWSGNTWDDGSVLNP